MMGKLDGQEDMTGHIAPIVRKPKEGLGVGCALWWGLGDAGTQLIFPFSAVGTPT